MRRPGALKCRRPVLEPVKAWPGSAGTGWASRMPASLDRLYVFHAVRRRVAPRVHAGHERLLSFSTELIRREQPLTASAQSCW